MLRSLPIFRPLSRLVILVGVAGGAIGAAYVGALNGLTAVIGPDGHGHWWVVGVLGAAGLTIGVLTRLLGDPGDVDLLVDNIHVAGGSSDVRALRSLVPVSLIGIAAGGALGPEAPLVQTAGTVGTVVGERGRQRPDQVRILTITGMAAAFTVLFGAPLGSAIFAVEILHRRGLEYYEALMPALGGSLIGFAVYLGLDGTGFGPVFEFAPSTASSAVDLGWAALAAAAGAVIALVFTVLVRAFRWCVGPMPAIVRPAIGGLGVGLLSLWSVGALTFGEHQIASLIEPGVALSAVFAALVCKLAASALCLTTGWRGGFIIPLFYAGAAAGLLIHAAIPGVDVSMLMAACMVAANVGVTKTPLGSTLVVTEMAGLHLLPTTTLAAVVAIVLTSGMHLLSSQRPREAAA